MANNVNYVDVEQARGSGNLKLNQSIRNDFIRKVYAIVCMQLITTAVVSATAMFYDPVNAFFVSNAMPIIVISGIIEMGIACFLVCKKDAKESFPTNYILLGIHNIAVSCLVACYACVSSSTAVLQAFLTASAIVAGLTLFAFQTKYDITGWGSYMAVVLLGFILFGILRLFFGGPIVRTIYGVCGAIIFGIYLIIDTQLLIGKGKISFEEDDYIIAALMIYMDIINLFIYLLEIFRSNQ